MKQLFAGTTGDYRPLSFFNPLTNEFEGYDINLANELGKLLDAKITFVKTSWPELSSDLKNKKFDFAIGGISITPKRLENFLMTDPYLKTGKTILCPKADEEKFKVKNPDAINRPEITVICNPGGTNEAFVREKLPRCRLIIHSQNQEIPQIIAGKKDCIMITETVEAEFYAGQNPELCAPLINRPFTQSSFGIMVNKDNPKLLQELNLGLLYLKKNAFFRKNNSSPAM